MKKNTSTSNLPIKGFATCSKFLPTLWMQTILKTKSMIILTLLLCIYILSGQRWLKLPPSCGHWWHHLLLRIRSVGSVRPKCQGERERERSKRQGGGYVHNFTLGGGENNNCLHGHVIPLEIGHQCIECNAIGKNTKWGFFYKLFT